MMALAYGNWETIVNEHVIRAIDIRVNTRGEAEGILNTEERSRVAEGYYKKKDGVWKF